MEGITIILLVSMGSLEVSGTATVGSIVASVSSAVVGTGCAASDPDSGTELSDAGETQGGVHEGGLPPPGLPAPEPGPGLPEPFGPKRPPGPYCRLEFVGAAVVCGVDRSISKLRDSNEGCIFAIVSEIFKDLTIRELMW